MLELGGAYKSTVWSSSQEWLAVPDPPYQVTYSRWVASFAVVYTLSP